MFSSTTLLLLLCCCTLLLFGDRGVVSCNSVSGDTTSGITGDFGLSMTQGGWVYASLMVKSNSCKILNSLTTLLPRQVSSHSQIYCFPMVVARYHPFYCRAGWPLAVCPNSRAAQQKMECDSSDGHRNGPGISRGTGQWTQSFVPGVAVQSSCPWNGMWSIHFSRVAIDRRQRPS